MSAYRDSDGRELLVDEVAGDQVRGTLTMPDGRRFPYSCTAAAFERVWVEALPELPVGSGSRGPSGNAGGAKAYDGARCSDYPPPGDEGDPC